MDKQDLYNELLFKFSENINKWKQKICNLVDKNARIETFNTCFLL